MDKQSRTALLIPLVLWFGITGAAAVAGAALAMALIPMRLWYLGNAVRIRILQSANASHLLLRW